MYNQRRTEAFRRRRMEEEMLLAMPIGRINGEALDKAQQIVVRNAKRAEAARARYQRMTPDQRKNYNQKRYTPKRRGDSRLSGGGGGSDILTGHSIIGLQQQQTKKEEMDALTSLERDVIKRTQQAQQALMRQGQQRAAAQQQGGSESSTPGPSQGGSGGSYIIQQAPGQHLGGQVVHVTHQMQGQGHSIIQQQGFQQGLPTSQSSGQQHLVVHHTAAPTSVSHLVVHHGQGSSGQHSQAYTANGVMINGQQQQQQQGQQQVMNPYGAPPRN